MEEIGDEKRFIHAGFACVTYDVFQDMLQVIYIFSHCQMHEQTEKDFLAHKTYIFSLHF